MINVHMKIKLEIGTCHKGIEWMKFLENHVTYCNDQTYFAI